MRLINYFILFLLLFLILSCDQPFYSELDMIKLIGTWKYESYDDEFTTYSRVDQLENFERGYVFFEDGNVIMRINISHCGNGILIEDTEGKWTMHDGEIIEINTIYNSESYNRRIEIVDINFKKMIIKHH